MLCKTFRSIVSYKYDIAIKKIMRMKVFTIYARGAQDVLALDDRMFDQWAFIFGPFWAFYNKMWVIGLVSVILMFFSANVAAGFSADLSQYISNLFLVSYGVFGCDLMSYKLTSNGYKLQDVILAQSVEEAEVKYLSRN